MDSADDTDQINSASSVQFAAKFTSGVPLLPFLKTALDNFLFMLDVTNAALRSFEPRLTLETTVLCGQRVDGLAQPSE